MKQHRPQNPAVKLVLGSRIFLQIQTRQSKVKHEIHYFSGSEYQYLGEKGD